MRNENGEKDLSYHCCRYWSFSGRLCICSLLINLHPPFVQRRHCLVGLCCLPCPPQLPLVDLQVGVQLPHPQPEQGWTVTLNPFTLLIHTIFTPGSLEVLFNIRTVLEQPVVCRLEAVLDVEEIFDCELGEAEDLYEVELSEVADVLSLNIAIGNDGDHLLKCVQVNVSYLIEGEGESCWLTCSRLDCCLLLG